MAQGLWEEAGCALPPTFAPALIAHLASPHGDVRHAAAAALAEGAGQYLEVVPAAVDQVIALYNQGQREDSLAARAGALRHAVRWPEGATGACFCTDFPLSAAA